MRKIVIPAKTLYECRKCEFRSRNKSIVQGCEAMPVGILDAKENQIVYVKFKRRTELYEGLGMVVLPVYDGKIDRVQIGRTYHHAKSCLINLGFPYPRVMAESRAWTYNAKLFPWEIQKILTKQEIGDIISMCSTKLRKLEKELENLNRAPTMSVEEMRRSCQIADRKMHVISTGLKILNKHKNLAPDESKKEIVINE